MGVVEMLERRVQGPIITTIVEPLRDLKEKRKRTLGHRETLNVGKDRDHRVVRQQAVLPACAARARLPARRVQEKHIKGMYNVHLKTPS